VHIFVFTLAFMWVGAMKTRKKSAYAAVAMLVLCAGTFLVFRGGTGAAPDLAGLNFFNPIVAFTQNMVGISSASETQIFGFLSFAYTYHYLNWFSKAEIIHWNRIPRDRLIGIVAIYAVTLSVYAYSYTLGFMMILTLSLLHVLLEFPLNLRTFAAIARGTA
jgi:hypothetical protein